MLYQLSYSRPGSSFVSRFTPRGGEGRIRTFEGISRQIYSLLPLATRVPLHDRARSDLRRGPSTTPQRPLTEGPFRSWRRDLNPRPAVYKTAALPLSYASRLDKRQMLTGGSRPFKASDRIFRLFRSSSLPDDLVEQCPDRHRYVQRFDPGSQG